MSDAIDQDRFYSYKEPAWHGLGYVSPTAMPIDEALVAADMDFEWSKSPIHTTVLDTTGIETIDIPDKFAVIRRNKRDNERKAFGPVGDKYTVHSANEIFSFIDALQGGGAVLETVGSLGRGEREFVVVRLPDTVMVGGKDATNLYLTGTTSFDGSTATRFDLTGVRIVCSNTWRLAQRLSQGKVTFRHTSHLDGSSDLQKAQRVLELSTEMSESMQEMGNRLLGITLRDQDAAEVLATLFPFPDHVKPHMDRELLSPADNRIITKQSTLRQSVFQLYKKSEVRAQDETAWGLFNAVTEFADHYSSVRGDDKQSVRAEKVLLGEFDEIKGKALDLMLV